MSQEIPPQILLESPKKLSFKKEFIFLVLSLFIIIIVLIFNLFVGSFSSFEKPKLVEIKEGSTLKQVSRTLKENGVSSSESVVSSLAIILGGDSHIFSGLYSFDKKIGDYFVVKRIMTGDFKTQGIKVTIPEGFNINQIADRLEKNIPQFSKTSFLELAKGKEGYLFPETYFFSINTKPEEIVKKMEDTFWQKVGEKFSITKENKDFKDKLILASIIEEEVRTQEEKKIVAGIFYNRLKIGMALQADSTLAYVTGRDSLSLTVDDLKMESAYNTYKNRGLPPTPISNPGLESIDAVLNPTPNQYFYFLTDKEGKVYYAKTFEEHKQNKFKYLR